MVDLIEVVAEALCLATSATEATCIIALVPPKPRVHHGLFGGPPPMEAAPGLLSDGPSAPFSQQPDLLKDEFTGLIIRVDSLQIATLECGQAIRILFGA